MEWFRAMKIRAYSRRAKWVLYPSVVIQFVNFFSYLAISLYLGGYAHHGYTNAGQYFLCQNGSCVEVSSTIWDYSNWHRTATLYGQLILFAEAAILVNTGDIEWE